MSDPVQKVAPWEDIVLRSIAIYKFIKAILALALAVTLLKLVHHDVSQFLRDYILGPLHFDPEDESEGRFISWLLDYSSTLTAHAKRLMAYTGFFYAIVFALEGIGLYLKKHWAEYMVLIVTGSFLPFEGYALVTHAVWWKLVLIIGNLLIMAYLFHRIKLDAYNAGIKKAQLEASRSASADRPSTSPAVASEVP